MTGNNPTTPPSPDSQGNKESSTLKKTLGWLLRGGVTFGIIAYLISQADLKALGNYLKEADLLYIAAALLCVGGSIVVTSVRWKFLMQVADLHYSIARTTAINFIGYFFNAFLPGSTGGDLAKAYYLIRDDKSKLTAAISSIAADRIIGLMTLLTLGALALISSKESLAILSENSNIITILQTMGFGVVFMLLILFFFPFHVLPAMFRKLWRAIPFHQWFEDLYHTLRNYRYNWKLSLLAVMLSFLGQALIIVCITLLCRSLGLEVKLLQMCLIVPIIVCAMGLPISFNGHGVREYMFVLMLTAFNIVPDDEQGKAAALAVSFLFLSSIFIWNLFGGLVFLFNKRHQGKSSS